MWLLNSTLFLIWLPVQHHGMVHVDPRIGTVGHGIVLDQRVLHRDVPEGYSVRCDPVGRRIRRRAFQAALRIENNIVSYHHAIRVLHSNARTFVQQGKCILHEVALHDVVAVHTDADVSYGAHVVAADHVVRSGEANAHVPPVGLAQPDLHGDILEIVQFGYRIVVQHGHRCLVGTGELVAAVRIVVAIAEDAHVQVLEGAVANGDVVCIVHEYGALELMLEVQAVHHGMVVTEPHPETAVTHRGLHEVAVRVGVRRSMEVEHAGIGIMVPFPGSIQFAQFVAQEDSPSAWYRGTCTCR